ncbi:hypothetical protein [Chitinophaga sp. Cy-1792]|uniref:hypothetical protein n=1 Tax=Chitinophaga sp. Cy-1792 TaxID=2608339 RepID=UPI00141F33A9|nr:hypothetical protein [Chitinophaga sp. Cy-1792]NIG52811.1 hypothetical protein [Chitinophaga sp. Cy-1792]
MQKELETWCAAHPSTSVNNYTISAVTQEKAIVFLFASWSPTIVQLKTLLQSLTSNPEIPLFVYDIDNVDYLKISDTFHSDGWGETFWIKAGQVIATLKKYAIRDLNKLIVNNNQLIS